MLIVLCLEFLGMYLTVLYTQIRRCSILEVVYNQGYNDSLRKIWFGKAANKNND